MVWGKVYGLDWIIDTLTDANHARLYGNGMMCQQFNVTWH